MTTKHKINYIEGDLFEAIKDKTCRVVLPHICNVEGAFGAGFVVPLSKHFPEARASYFQCNPKQLGDVDFVWIKEKNILICNMIAQTLGGKRPIYYNHLAVCLNKVVDNLTADCEIHAPAFGSGLAGGSYDIIEPLIYDAWIRPFKNPPPVNIYYLPGTFIPPG